MTQENISATRIIVGESHGWRGVNVSNAKTARTVANGRSWDVAFQTLNCTLSLSIPHVDDSSYQKDSSSLFRKKVDSEWNNPFQQRRGAIEGAIRWVETWKSKLTQWKGKLFVTLWTKLLGLVNSPFTSDKHSPRIYVLKIPYLWWRDPVLHLMHYSWFWWKEITYFFARYFYKSTKANIGDFVPRYQFYLPEFAILEDIQEMQVKTMIMP